MAGARAKYSSDGITFNNIYGSVVGAPSLYKMPAFHETCIYIGKYTASEGASHGNTLRLRLCFSAGYNGNLVQMMDAYVNFCFGNGSGTLYNCWVDYLPENRSEFQVKYKVTNNVVDFYLIQKSYNGNGYYIVSYDSSNSVWEDKCTSMNEPSGLQLPTEIGKEVVVSSTAPTSPSAMIWIQS